MAGTGADRDLSRNYEPRHLDRSCEGLTQKPRHLDRSEAEWRDPCIGLCLFSIGRKAPFKIGAVQGNRGKQNAGFSPLRPCGPPVEMT